MRRLVLPLVAGVLATASALFTAPQEETVIEPAFRHLGDDFTPEWPEAAPEPEGTRLDLEFELSGEATGAATLFASARSVGTDWRLELNGTELGTLRRGDELKEQPYPVPAGILQAGRNRLSVVPDDPADDITIGAIRLDHRPFRQVLRLRPVVVRVLDRDGDAPLPARITIAREDGELVPTYFASSSHTAVRDGIVYVAEGEARFEVPEGRYRLFATRGVEWSLAAAELVVEPGAASTVELRLERELDTTGFVACDTHIHTFEISRHGDATLEERVVTLAGEGVELAIATDHNHNTDYRPYQQRLGLGTRFTSVVGNEVTTDVGHFNAFPLDPGDEVPGFRSADYVELVAGMRAKGAQVVVLNHPRWPDHDRGPFGAHGLDRYSGERASGVTLPVDATELINSTTEEADPMFLFVDWFALLNRGERIAAVGSSDSHTVGDPVGQGRTYVASSTDDPARIDVDEACTNLRAGRASISQGIFVDVRVDGRYGMGQRVPVSDREVAVELRVAAPGWVQPQRALVFLNGLQVAELAVPASEGATDTRLTVSVPTPGHDAWLVCVVLGAGVRAPYWKTLNDYTLAATNPVYLDVDGDGSYASPHASAERLLAEHGSDPFSLRRSINGCDAAVAVQLLALARDAWLAEVQARLGTAGAGASEASPFVAGYLRGLEPAR